MQSGVIEFPEASEWSTEGGAADQVLELDFNDLDKLLDPMVNAPMIEYIRAILIKFAGEVHSRMEERCR